MNRIKVLVFEDNPAMSESIAGLLATFPRIEYLGTLPNANNIVEDAKLHKPDIILLDINMPGLNGVEAAALCKTAIPNVQIIMQTVFEDEEKVFEAIKAGASGYILKKNILDRLEQSIYDVYAGGSHLSPGIARKVLQSLQAKNPTKTTNQAIIQYQLSSRETDVLKLMVQGMSYKLIADHLNLSVYTVNSHVRSIFSKLHVHSMSEAIFKTHRENLL